MALTSIPVKQIGNTRTLIEQVENPVSMAPDGSGVGTVSWKSAWSVIQNNIPVPLTPHPSFPSLLLYEFTITRESGDLGRIDAVYRGVLAGDPFALVQEEVSVATSSEPIETHPLFAYPFSAPPVSVNQINEINLALDNCRTPNGTVTGAAYQLYYHKLHGIDSYLRRGTTYKQNYCANTFPTDYSSVGYIDTPGGNAPPPPSGAAVAQNYISTGISWRRMGGVIYISREWQMSGIGGWDTYLYSKNSAKSTSKGPAIGATPYFKSIKL
jgi:hypothetical protein